MDPDGTQKDELQDAGQNRVQTSEEVGSTSSSSSGSTGPSGPDTTEATTLPAAFQAAKTAAVDLWDNGWPTDRYYWTAVPVQAITTFSGTTATTQWVDLEAPQDECAAGHVGMFGKVAKPAVAADGKPYAVGMSPNGALADAAAPDPKFYGATLVSWQPVSGATGYEVQWSKSLYPWKTEGTPILTASTSTTLGGLAAGTWYYRVRGLDPYLPGPLQKLAWSDPVEVEIAAPTFAVASDGYATKPAVTQKRTVTRKAAIPTGFASYSSYAGEFTLGLPRGWKVLPKAHPLVSSLAKGQFSSGYKLEFVGYDPKGVVNGYATDCVVLRGAGRGNATLSAWARAQVAGLRASLRGAPFAKRLVRLAGGWALRVSYRVETKDGKQVWALTHLFDEVSASYALSCSATSSLRHRYEPVFDSAAKTFLVVSG
jgi:hypothetical protein